MPRIALIAGAVFGVASLVGAKDPCTLGSYFDVDADECVYCMNAPLGSYYTANGNFTSECPYEECVTCPIGEYNLGCGYDDQTNDPPSICFSMTDFADICSAGPSYCTVIPTTYSDYDDCSDYCDDNGLTCLASYNADDCGDSVDDLTEGSCSDSMAEDTICACHLATCEEDIHQTGIVQCDYYVDTKDYCPYAGNTAALEDQLFAIQNCRVSCEGCVTGDSFGAGECTPCSGIADGSEGVYFSTDGDRSDSCTVSDCDQSCFIGEYNAGCGYNDYKENTFSCALCMDTCGAGNYISEVCDGSGFEDTTECEECDESCDIGYYIGATCDGTTTYDSTECVLCTASCNPGFYMDGEFCDGTAYESQAQCIQCTTECEDGEFPTGSCDGSGTSDEIVCKDCYSECDKDCDDCDCFEACFRTTVLGGSENWALNTFDAVGGGLSNQAGYLESDSSGMGDDDKFNVVIGGYANTVGGTYSAITGGFGNTAFGVAVTVLGGVGNVAASTSGGTFSIGLLSSSIGGGTANTATGDYSVVLGGDTNVATASYSASVAGNANEASGSYSNILGGNQNSVRGSWAGVGGGKLNKAWANYATCPGGYLGKAAARFAMVLGGSKNTAKGRYSFVAGFKAKATKDYSGVMAFSGETCKDNGVGTFNICADYVYINGYDVTELLESANGRRTRRLTDGTEVHTNGDAEMRRLARNMGYTLEPTELESELEENEYMLKRIDTKLGYASEKLRALDRLVQPASLRTR